MSSGAVWGKRPREGDGEEFVRFRELSQAQKAHRRREERAEKKERDRTLAYFNSVQRALQEHGSGSSGGGDAGALASIVDGFFSELLKLLKADSTFYILRSGTACRVVEMALANALLLHVKSLLYVFLGHVNDLLLSPVASYTLETLLASLSQGLSALAETNAEGLEAEIAEGGAGMHTGSGVPSTATLLSSMVEEITENGEMLITHDIGGRALRSVVLMLGGHCIRQAPLSAHPVTFPRLLGVLADAILTALEEGYGREYQATNPAEAWMAAVQTPVTSLVIQSLLRVSEEGTVVDRCVRQRMEHLTYKGKPLLHHFLTDPLGCHVFQGYLRVAAPRNVLDEGDAAALRAGSPAEEKVEDGVPGGDTSCCWCHAAGLFLVDVDNMLKPSSDLVAQAGYVLQDLVLYAPTATHLRWLWLRVLEPRLELLFDVSALTPVLVQLVKRCAFGGVTLTLPPSSGLAAASERDDDTGALRGAELSHHGTVLPADIVAMLRKDAAQQVRYSLVPIALQTAVCSSLCLLAKKRSPKGAVQFLLVDAALGDKGYEVARYLLHLHPTASAVLQYALDKLQRNDLIAVACHRKGSLFLQQYVRVAALATRRATASSVQPKSSTYGGSRKGTVDASPVESKGPLMRLFRRLQPSLHTLVYDMYAAFVVEELYEHAPMSVKEALVMSLVPLYQEMRTLPVGASPSPSLSFTEDESSAAVAALSDPPGEETATRTAASPPQKRYIASKVMLKCCVEQYVHRREDWAKLAERQCHVHRLLCRTLLSE